MSIAIVGIIPAQLLTIGFEWSHLPSTTRFTGCCIAILGYLIFLISVPCMKDSSLLFWKTILQKYKMSFSGSNIQ